MIKTVVDVALRRLICLVVSLPLTYISLAMLVLITEPHRDGLVSERELLVLISCAVFLQLTYFFLAAAVMQAARRWTVLRENEEPAPDERRPDPSNRGQRKPRASNPFLPLPVVQRLPIPLTFPGLAKVQYMRVFAVYPGRTSTHSFTRYIKRFIDVIASALLLIAYTPILLAIGVAIKISAPGQPILCSQKRSAPSGKQFRIYKFRTLPDHPTDGRFLSKNDGRATPVGRLLRKTRLDELPRLFAVLVGDMSLVGPPAIPLQAYEKLKEQLSPSQTTFKPGITGLWQAMAETNLARGRQDALPSELWMGAERVYAEHWSLGLDVQILAKTILVVTGFSRRERLEVDIDGSLLAVPA